MAKKSNKKSSKKNAAKQPRQTIRTDVESVLGKAKKAMTIREVFEVVNKRRKPQVTIFGVRRVCNDLEGPLSKKVAKRQVG